MNDEALLDAFDFTLANALEAIEHRGLVADGNVSRLVDAQHESAVTMRLTFSGYDPREDLARLLLRGVLRLYSVEQAELLWRGVVADVVSRKRGAA